MGAPRAAAAGCACAAALAVAPMAGPLAAAAPPAVTVSEASLVSSPYRVDLDPNGELRVLSFPDALVSSVVVAKPWLLTVLVQGHDVVLQAKATSGETQLIAYADRAGTLWSVVIGTHPPVASRIVVSHASRGSVEPAPAARPSAQQPVAPGQARVPSKFAAFVAALRADQRTAFDVWQRDPTTEKLSAFLVLLDATQRGRFEQLVGAGDVAVPQAIAAPRLIQTTTVVATLPAGLPPQTAAGPAPTGPGQRATNAAGADAGLYAYPAGVPAGVTVTASADRTGDMVTLRYTIHNGLPVWLRDGRVSARDGHGASVAFKDDGPHAIAPGAEAHGSVTTTVSALPVTIGWTWTKATTQRIPLIGLDRRIEQGVARFYVVVTP